MTAVVPRVIGSIRRGEPWFVRRSLREAQVVVRRRSAHDRVLPSFLIIGAQRCGTTSLYRYLTAHPEAAPAVGKELQYFSLHHGRGEGWYRAHFPRAADAAGRHAFEASPYYLYHPLVPARAAGLLPEARIVVLLRDPVRRAFSHYQHSVALGQERLSFDEALDAEPARLAGEEDCLRREPGRQSLAHRSWSYQDRGVYAPQLERWLEHYPRGQVKVVLSEDLFGDTDRVYGDIQRFLGLRAHHLPSYAAHTRRPAWAGPPMSEAARARLGERFEQPNRRLSEILGRDVPWPA